MKLLKGKKYKVTWLDITTENEWFDLKQIREWVEDLKPMVSTWTFIEKKGDWLLFSSGISKDKEKMYFDVVALPKGVILKAILIK